MTERRLDWEGCLNVRDLGGHPTEDDGVTRIGAVVRADSVRRLTPAGWEALVDYGIRRIVDLRLASELEEDGPGEVPVEVVHVPFFEEVSLEKQIEIAELWLSAPDDVSATRDGYLEMLDSYSANVAAAISAVAEAPEGGVLIHCMGGKDRTGLVAALLLRVARVPTADIAADYGLSSENIKPLWQQWVDDAGDDAERELRRRLSASPADAMAQVLGALERDHGSVEAYLIHAGATQEALERARSRIRS
jgi:protein tyrosine/serine phosphatase